MTATQTVSFEDALKLALRLQAENRLDDARAVHVQLLKAFPDAPDVIHFWGMLLHKSGRTDEAIKHLSRSIDILPNAPTYQNNFATVLQSIGRLDEAEVCVRRALALAPAQGGTHYNLANLLRIRGKRAEAIESFRSALKCGYSDKHIHYDFAKTLLAEGRHEDALEQFKNSLGLDQQNAGLWTEIADLCSETNDLQRAKFCYTEAIRLDPPGSVQLLTNLANAMFNTSDYAGAIEFHEKAIRANSALPQPYNNLAGVHLWLGDQATAETYYRRALEADPKHLEALSNVLMCAQYAGSVEPHDLFDRYKQYGKFLEGDGATLSPSRVIDLSKTRRLKIGYVSGDFRFHSVAYFILPVLLNHDKSQFETFCYYNNYASDDVTAALRQAADHWVPCRSMTDAELCSRIQDDQIDILIDLSGLTALNRIPVLAKKPAPIQATYAGYPGTSGLTSIDYRITDSFLDPPGLTEKFHTEKLLRVDGVSATFHQLSEPAPLTPLPALAGAPFTFSCFNTPAKITPKMLVLWANILNNTPGSQIVFGNAGIALFEDRIRRLLANEGVVAERVQFKPRVQVSEFFKLHDHVDLALDTFPYQGGTTTFHSLYMGVPTVSMLGRSTPSRCSAAVLTPIGLDQFIASTPEEYVNIATYWFGKLPELNALRQGMRERLANTPYPAPVVTRNIEKALRGAWVEYCESHSAS